MTPPIPAAGKALVIELSLLIPLEEGRASSQIDDARNLVKFVEDGADGYHASVLVREVRFS